MLSALLALAGRALADDDPVADDLPDLAGAELARSSLDVGAELIDESLAATSGLVDVASLHEHAARSEPSPWGRFDLAIAWRRVEELAERTRDEVWLVATWRN